MGANAVDALEVGAMRGYASLGQSMCVHDLATDSVHTSGLVSVRNYLARMGDHQALPLVGKLEKGAANRFLSLFDDPSLFVLEDDGHTWTYKGRVQFGLMIGRRDGRLYGEHHRIAHLLHHSFEDPLRVSGRGVPRVHGAFDTTSFERMFDWVDEVYRFGNPVPGSSGLKVLTTPIRVGTSNFDATQVFNRGDKYIPVSTVLGKFVNRTCVTCYPLPP